MKDIFLSKQFVIAVCLVCLACMIGLLVRSAFAEEPKSQAVIELEKEMAKDVPIYQDVAPRLSKNRAALEALGYSFDDHSLKAVPLAQ